MGRSRFVTYTGVLLVAVAVFLAGTWSNVAADGPPDEDPALYGTRANEPILLDGAAQIFLPGGTKIQHRNNHDVYPLADHLRSNRVVPSRDEYNEYGPMGGVARGTVPVYTGKSWDAATRTYDFLARQYDPPTGRFLSRDPAQTSAGPYSYADANPINKVDPDGMAPGLFFLYSGSGSQFHDLDLTAVPRYSEIARLASRQGVPIGSGHLESRVPFRTQPPPDRHILTVVGEGTPGLIRLTVPESGQSRLMTGGEFAPHLESRMRQEFGNAVDHVRSINLLNCYGACQTPHWGGPTGTLFC